MLLAVAMLLGAGAATVAARTPDAQQPARQTAEKSTEKADLLVSGGTVVTMDPARRVIEDGAVAIRGDGIVAVGPRAELETRFPHATRRIEAQGKIILPGLINGHTHAAMTLLRGIANDLNLQDWLEKYIFPAEARNVTEDFVTWGTRLAALEMIRGGTTTFADMYYFEDAAARATKEAGMRGVLGESVIDFPVPDAKTPDEALANIEKFLQRWKGDPLIRPAIAVHSAYLCSAETLKKAAALARRYKATLLIHVLETKRESDESFAKRGMSPVAYLDSIGFLGPDVVAAHCVWFSDEDIALAVKRDIGCVHNPSSNMMLASGTAPVVDMLRAGLRLGLGTDGPAGSNNDLNMMEEIDLAAKLQKVTRLDPRALSAEQALEMATIGGARALHMESEIGSLEPGKKADLILLRTDAPHAVPMYDVVSQIAYALKASDVETVIVNGRILMQDRRMLTLNEAEIVAKAREYAEKVKRSLGPVAANRAVEAQTASTSRASSLFDFHASFWMNLHHTLYHEAVVRLMTEERRKQVGAEPLAEAELNDAEKTAWHTAIDYYAKTFRGRRLLFDDELVKTNDRLAAHADGEADLADAQISSELVGNLRAAAPVYRKHWWPKHEQGDRAWIAAMLPRIEEEGAAIASQLEGAFRTHWPAQALRVDVADAVGEIGGAYTTDHPPHTTLSSARKENGGLPGLETVFHEAAHTMSDGIETALSEACHAEKKECADLWHAMLFYTVGEIVRLNLAKHGETNYKAYAYEFGLYGRGKWPAFRPALERGWQPYLDGKTDFSSAIKAVVDGIPAKK